MSLMLSSLHPAGKLSETQEPPMPKLEMHHTRSSLILVDPRVASEMTPTNVTTVLPVLSPELLAVYRISFLISLFFSFFSHHCPSRLRFL